MRRALPSLVACVVLACGSQTPNGFGDTDAGSSADATVGPDVDAGTPVFTSDAAPTHDCTPDGPDMSGCPCNAPGTTRGCYTGDVGTRTVGSCKDGKQTCAKEGEFSAWSACTGDVTPTNENCAGTVDTNCNGKVGCADPTCASSPVCDTSCTNGQTRPCYTGPAGTENVGTCKDGVQTCVGGRWTQGCTGQVTPQAENCCDALDHNCNHVPGCWDFLFCATAACCQSSCPQQLDPGCSCPQGAGDTQTCPDGNHIVQKGGIFPPVEECCPCTTSTCNDINCCGNAVCATAPACSGLTCKPLPAACKGQVSTDCDDFPEDCDEPCCKCTKCP